MKYDHPQTINCRCIATPIPAARLRRYAVERIRTLVKRARAVYLVGAYYAIAGAGALILGSVASAQDWSRVFVSVCLALGGLCTLAVSAYLVWGLAAMRRAEAVAWSLEQADVLKAAAAATSPKLDPRGRRVVTYLHGKQPTERWEPHA